eukprot:3287793-Rhodomonas_salina.7
MQVQEWVYGAAVWHYRSTHASTEVGVWRCYMALPGGGMQYPESPNLFTFGFSHDWYCPANCPALTVLSLLTRPLPLCLSAYCPATPCPVPTLAISAIRLRARYDMSDTDVGSAATTRCMAGGMVRMSGTISAIVLRARYAMSGTDMGILLLSARLISVTQKGMPARITFRHTKPRSGRSVAGTSISFLSPYALPVPRPVLACPLSPYAFPMPCPYGHRQRLRCVRRVWYWHRLCQAVSRTGTGQCGPHIGYARSESGTELGYARAESGTEVGYGAGRRLAEWTQQRFPRQIQASKPYVGYAPTRFLRAARY